MSEQTFKQAYETLQNHAKTLREQEEPNIDDLLTIVTESVSAYNTCKARIDAVEEAMNKAFSRVDDEGFATDAQNAGSNTTDNDAADEDIPF